MRRLAINTGDESSWALVFARPRVSGRIQAGSAARGLRFATFQSSAGALWLPGRGRARRSPGCPLIGHGNWSNSA